MPFDQPLGCGNGYPQTFDTARKRHQHPFSVEVAPAMKPRISLREAPLALRNVWKGRFQGCGENLRRSTFPFPQPRWVVVVEDM